MAAAQPDSIDILRREFEAAEGSFLIQLRAALTWDRAAFSRLVAAMETCCRRTEGEETCERWVAEGFWYLSWFVKDWTTHPNFPRPHEPSYYEAAYRRLDELAYWFFTDDDPYETGSGFEPL